MYKFPSDAKESYDFYAELYDIIEAQGWNSQSVLNMALNHIESIDSKSFITKLQEMADEENAA